MLIERRCVKQDCDTLDCYTARRPSEIVNVNFEKTSDVSEVGARNK